MTHDDLVQRRLALARAFMDEHYDAALDLAQIAAQASFSRYHFLRLFRSTFDQTPHQYLTGLRIERAKQLLAAGDMSVTEVCLAVGFDSLGSFSTLFHRHVGQAPSVYRARVFAGWRSRSAPIPMCFVKMFGLRPALSR
jgi:AraC-like DNA-binding protein